MALPADQPSVDPAPVRRWLRNFAEDRRGVVSVEFAIMVPLVLWAFMALYVYFDGYRQSSINLKAAYTISDILSRETGIVDEGYIDGMQELFQFLTRSGSDNSIRISVISWNQADDRYYVDWSSNRDWQDGTDLNDSNIMGYSDKLPVMANSQRLVLVETRNTYAPVFKVGMDDIELENFVFMNPRFVQNVAWDGGGST
ncbi:MAG: pilus assembly protein [Pseudomonadota bacterium]